MTVLYDLKGEESTRYSEAAWSINTSQCVEKEQTEAWRKAMLAYTMSVDEAKDCFWQEQK